MKRIFLWYSFEFDKSVDQLISHERAADLEGRRNINAVTAFVQESQFGEAMQEMASLNADNVHNNSSTQWTRRLQVVSC
jgi:hypothetical protein